MGNRAEGRRIERHQQKLEKELNKLTPNQLKLFNEVIEQRTNETLEIYKKLVDEAVFTALRENRVGEEIANRVMDHANKLIREEIDKQEKKVS